MPKTCLTKVIGTKKGSLSVTDCRGGTSAAVGCTCSEGGSSSTLDVARSLLSKVLFLHFVSIAVLHSPVGVGRHNTARLAQSCWLVCLTKVAEWFSNMLSLAFG